MAKTTTINIVDLQLADGQNGITVVATAPYLEDSAHSESRTINTENLTYALSTDGLSYIVTGMIDKTFKSITIPDTYTGSGGTHPVRGIASSAFSENEDLEDVTITANMRNIGMDAFAGCINLKKVTFTDRKPVIYIKDNGSWNGDAYSWDPNDGVNGNLVKLIKSLIGYDSSNANIYRVEVPLGATNVGIDNTNDTESVVMGKSDIRCFGCYEIYKDDTGENKFRLCDPDCVAVEADRDSLDLDIGSRAFQYCDSLTSVNIPNTVLKLGGMSFGNAALETVTFSTTSGLKRIYAMAFSECLALTEIKFPDTLEQIDNHSFESCTALTKVTAGTKLKVIGPDAFTGCKALATFLLNSGSALERIGTRAFLGCSKLSSFGEGGRMPQTVWYIGVGAFEGCSSLRTINFGGSDAATSGWFYTSGTVKDDRTTDGDYTAISASFLLNATSAATGLTSAQKNYTWFRIKKMPAPEIAINGSGWDATLDITDKTGIAQAFIIYANGTPWRRYNAYSNSLESV